MTGTNELGRIDRTAWVRRRLAPVRLLLPLGWLLGAIGYVGPWIAHPTAALTLTGVDMAEFVKFLPGGPEATSDGLRVVRQLFYLPPVAVVVTVALLIGSRRLAFPWLLRLPTLFVALLMSLQLLPPAWSPASLMTAEFRLQTIALLACWLLLASFWLLGRLTSWLAGALTTVLALSAGILASWQFLLVKPAIDQVYGAPPAIGWGFFLCLGGVGLIGLASAILLLRAQTRSSGIWTRT